MISYTVLVLFTVVVVFACATIVILSGFSYGSIRHGVTLSEFDAIMINDVYCEHPQTGKDFHKLRQVIGFNKGVVMASVLTSIKADTTKRGDKYLFIWTTDDTREVQLWRGSYLSRARTKYDILSLESYKCKPPQVKAMGWHIEYPGLTCARK